MGSSETTRGLRNNNPGNIEVGAPWQGLMAPADMTPEQARETRFCVFTDPTWGIRAIARVLITYQDKRQAGDGSAIDTVQEIIERWAPAGENNSRAYAAAVRAAMGIAPGQTVDVHDYASLRALVTAIIAHENGRQPYTDAQIDKGLILAGVQPPARPSRTNSAGRIAIAATAAGAAVDAIADHAEEVTGALRGILPYLPSAGYLIAGVTLIAIGRMLYARWDDRRRGINP